MLADGADASKQMRFSVARVEVCGTVMNNPMRSHEKKAAEGYGALAQLFADLDDSEFETLPPGV